jgi:hypothetical protein
MPPLPESIITVLGAFVPLFSRPVWCHAQLLLALQKHSCHQGQSRGSRLHGFNLPAAALLVLLAAATGAGIVTSNAHPSSTPCLYPLRVVLRDVSPLIWRSLQVSQHRG